MKYIRTEDDIRPICGKNHITNTVSFYNRRGTLFCAIVEDSRIADTIKDLFDVFVYKKNLYEGCEVYMGEITKGIGGTFKLKDKVYLSIFKGQTHVAEDKCLLKNQWHNIYGAIWVKGEHNEPILKSVSRLNNKGEFELL